MKQRLSTWMWGLSLIALVFTSVEEVEGKTPKPDPRPHVEVGCREVSDLEVETVEWQRNLQLVRVVIEDDELIDESMMADIVDDQDEELVLVDCDHEEESEEAVPPPHYNMPGQEHAVRFSQGLPPKRSSYFFAEPYTYSTHHPKFYSPGGETVELENGSIWRVEDRDSLLVRSWLPSDALLIAPNYSWWSDFPFRLVNVGTKTSVQVKLKMGPFSKSKYDRWIVSIDQKSQELWLDDGSRWSLTGLDSAIFKKWQEKDHVIIGTNDDWLSYSMPNILINVTTYIPEKANLSYVRAVHKL